MQTVILTSLLVGGATMLGAVLGFFIKGRRSSEYMMPFCAGVMLCAAVVGLIVPSYKDFPYSYGIIITVLGVFAGALFLTLIERIVPGVDSLLGNGRECSALFVIAIAVHNFPEGLAAGVSFGTGSLKSALFIASGIALQNIPEGMVIISPMLKSGLSRKRTLFYALLTGVIEIIGTLIGYFLIGVANAILPFALAFAGGTMLYVINNEMIPQGSKTELGTYLLLLGFAVMLILDAVL